MIRYSLLNNVNARRRFDPTSEEDLKELKHYIEFNKWIGICPFYIEGDWDNIPVMCLYKYAKHNLDKQV